MKTVIAVALLLVTAGAAWGLDAGSGCVACHGDRGKMKELGAEAMYLDPVQVDREVNMKGKPTCVDCHLGDPKAQDKTAAHKGLLRPFLVAAGKKYKGEAISREEAGALQPLTPKGTSMSSMIPKGDPKKLEAAGVKRIVNIHWHDRDPQTMAYSPKVAEQTCGRCHSKAVQDYNSSTKGLSRMQRSFRSWSEKLPGPHNCGVWPGENEEGLRSQTSVPYSKQQNDSMGRSCNMCHPSCNDCHFKPVAARGTHAFGKPDNPSCSGGNRASICHGATMERRRGAGFVRGVYAFPPDQKQGAHIKAGLECLDCHKPANHQFGHLASDDARNSCGKCHNDIVKAVQASPHGKVECGSCHITALGAYQYTFWGKGHYFGVENPYGKHKDYYGSRDLPTIVRNPAGRWIPMKPYPMAVMNQTGELGPTGLLFRSIPKRTVPGNPKLGEPSSFEAVREVSEVNDAYIGVGTRSDLPTGNKTILWIQMEKLSHAMGKPRGCGSCHDSHAQVGKSQWSYFEERDVTKPFKGSYTITADKDGMRFGDVTWEEPQLAPNRRLEEVAPFAVLPKNAWDVNGIDLSIPFDDKKTATARKELDEFLKELDRRKDDPKVKEIRVIAYHNLAMAKKMLKKK
ncbi:MAG: cytochrome c3 family protein [Deltaproteobacteria bacterium]|nr:cytochrome c3 family protein [Deltaproteobacteria bacterium]